mmetsp:Transcript_62516/g.141009  ORF Transcript_62516/g.141009 Transcript_62516/m.141009 type:complete len:386 (+) Transcript_62516:106-1263(+)|eukprot:CAMPEP_0197904186 /NCGR_PEP_ID=MMETSP1439-20131203/57541_1 /TAXON_ID=66791 /ORGANISM="Gonyaulax spinifera, Strain CCMP409" /LENGTH=385 /DNA_ID=CAMNT_0043525357 /DNA_START=90 /DNA_END=1247 /DNA_ORIENTATION=-
MAGSETGNVVAAPARPTVPDFFEGTEKRIELDFTGSGDLRSVPRAGWEEVVRLSATQILNEKVTKEFTSFLLSESSLVVYPTKVIIKTCGRTVPICCVGKVLDLARGVGLEAEWLCYSRKNFLAPSAQPWEHQSKEAEIALCRQACLGTGDAYVLGQMTGDHWLVYDAQFKWTDCTARGDFQVDLMMYDLPKDVQQLFHTSHEEGSREGAKMMTSSSGLGDAVASIGGEIDDYCFSPCGYSCNVHAGDAYAMVHVTPQEGCSYASFETNFGSSRAGQPTGDISGRLNDLVGRVLDVFRPKRLTLTLFIDQGAEEFVGKAPFAAADTRYQRRTYTTTYFEQDYAATIANYVTAEERKRARERAGSQGDEPAAAQRRTCPEGEGASS